MFYKERTSLKSYSKLFWKFDKNCLHNVILFNSPLKFILPRINPLTPRRTIWSPFTEIPFLFKEWIIKKKSYKHRAYESVDEKSLY